MKESAFMIIVIIGFSSLGLCPPLEASVVHVPADAPTIQEGVNMASVGDSVIVSCGEYLEHEIEIKPGILIQSDSGNPDCVTVNGSGLGRVFHCANTGTYQTSMKGLTLTNGNADGGLSVNGSQYFSIEDCIFIENQGSGVRSNEAKILLTNCDFVSNISDYGGAVYASYTTLEIENCRFIDNIANSGGGALAAMMCPATVLNSLFTGNSVDQVYGEFGGGAILNWGGGVRLTSCTLTGNSSANNGGAVVADGPLTLPIHLINCSVRNNASSQYGGGIYCRKTGLEMDNTDVIENSASQGADGFIESDTHAELLCCDVNLEQWEGEGSINLDNTGCVVPSQSQNWGSLKAMYR